MMLAQLKECNGHESVIYGSRLRPEVSETTNIDTSMLQSLYDSTGIESDEDQGQRSAGLGQ